MERYLMNEGGILALVSQVGCIFNGSFFTSDETAEALEELLGMLSEDDRMTCQTRCQMHLAQLLSQKLVPLLGSLEDQDMEDQPKLYSLTVRLMTNLTQPTECLLPANLCSQPSYKDLINNMNRFLCVGRDAFLDGKVIKALLRYMDSLIQQRKHGEVPIEDCETLNNCLFLLRNLLFIQDPDYKADNGPRPYLILLGLLFQYGLTDTLMGIITSPQREFWCIATSQLVSLLYKEEVCTLNSTSSSKTVSQGMSGDHLAHPDSDKFPVHCANHTCENSLRSSVAASPQSNKTPPENLSSSDNSSSLPGDWRQGGDNLTGSSSSADVSDGKCSSSHIEQALSGSPQLDSQSPHEPSPGSPHSPSQPQSPSVSPQSQSSSSPQSGSPRSGSPQGGSSQGLSSSSSSSGDTNCFRHKGMHKLENEISIRLTQLQVREQLGLFTKTFLEEGFVHLVTAMRTILLEGHRSRLPDLYFMWIVGYFLNWAMKLQISFKYFKPCLSVDIVGFLVYIGVNSCEQLLLALQSGKDTTAAVRRNQLVLVALNKLFSVMDYLGQSDIDEEDQLHLHHLSSALVQMKDVKNFFVLMLRHYTAAAQSMEHLRDIILTNHKFLLIAEKVRSSNDTSFDMLQHIQSFSTRTIMGQYCRLLENFTKNSTEVNDCIFTMMYHVAGDVNKPEVLLQLPILKVFTEISETCINLPKECNDVMNYVLQYFLSLASDDPYLCAEMLFDNTVDMDISENNSEEGAQASSDGTSNMDLDQWSDAEKDILFNIYTESGSTEPISAIRETLAEQGYDRSPNEIAVQLCLQNFWSQEQIQAMIVTNNKHKNDELEGTLPDREGAFATHHGEQYPSNSSSSSSSGESQHSSISPPPSIEHLVGALPVKEYEEHVTWLQTTLLDTCYIKLGGRFIQEAWIPEEPVVLHYAIQKKAIPLVPYTEQEEQALNNKDFLKLIQALGLCMPQYGTQMWPRIPNCWSPHDLIAKAKLLGPVNFEMQKFAEMDIGRQPVAESTDDFTFSCQQEMSPGGSSKQAPGIYMTDLWHVFVKKCTLYNRKQIPQINQQSPWQLQS